MSAEEEGLDSGRSAPSSSSYDEFLRYLLPESEDVNSNSIGVAPPKPSSRATIVTAPSSKEDGEGAGAFEGVPTSASGPPGSPPAERRKSRQSRRLTLERTKSLFLQSGENRLTFRDVSFTVSVKGRAGLPSGKTKTILSGVSGNVSSGNVVAVMGPSGAGKSTLLKVLTLQAFGGTSNGVVQLNGNDLNFNRFRKDFAFVEQHDTLWSYLSVVEHLECAANMYLANDPLERRKSMVQELLETLGLDGALTTKAHALSGGQKRRLSLALAMIKSPRVLILDEITSGLDSASAFGVIEAIKTLAMATQVIVLCTIHQPSSLVFSEFTHTMLLANGRLVYMGTVDKAVPYFSERGYPLPQDTNPAEHLLDVINPEFSDQAQVDALIQVWQEKANSGYLVGEGESEHAGENGGGAAENRDSFFSLTNFAELVKRHSKLSIRDPSLYTGRAVAFCLTGILISIVYLDARSRSMDTAVERAIMLGWYFAVPSLLSIVVVPQTNHEMETIKYEVKMGLVKRREYIAARFIIELPSMVLLAIATLVVGGFVISAFNGTVFGKMLLVFSAVLLAFESLAQATTLMFSKAVSAMLLYVMVWFTCFLFSEVWVAEENVFLPLRLLFYVSPFRLALQAFAYLDFHDTEFACGNDLSLFSYIAYQKECVGNFNGDRVLDILGFVFPIFTSDVDVGWCIGATLIIAAAFKVVFIASVVIRLSKHSTITAATSVDDNNPRSRSNWFYFRMVIYAAIIGAIAGISFWMSRDESIGEKECLLALKRSDINFFDTNLDNYARFTDSDSVMKVAQAGSYYGPEDMLEYMMFAVNSDYIQGRPLRNDISFKMYDEATDICHFQVLFYTALTTNPNTTNTAVGDFDYTVMIRSQLDYSRGILKTNYGYLPDEYLRFVFHELGNSDATRQYICSVMIETCEYDLQLDECKKTLAALPLTTGDHYDFSGNTQGCRVVHAAFASTNPIHCPHISFEPEKDVKGKIKCQESLGMRPDEWFDSEDMAAFEQFQVDVGVDPSVGFIHYGSKADN